VTNPELVLCYHCEEPLTAQALPAHDIWDPSCNERDKPGNCLHGAHEACVDVENERAVDRALEDFYGGSGPASLDEQCLRAAREKDGLA
jgi:hypothetical protein